MGACSGSPSAEAVHIPGTMQRRTSGPGCPGLGGRWPCWPLHMNGPGPRDVAVRLQVSDLRARSSDVDPADRRCLDFVAYGATPLGEALCCDVTLVSPLTRDGRPQPSATTRDGAMISVAERRKRAAYHELCARGSSAYASARAKLADAGVLNRSALSRNSCGFALLLPCAVQLPRVGCAAAWWCLLSVALHSTLAATLLGTPYIAGAMPGSQLPAVGDVLHDAVPRHPEPPGPVVCSVQGDPDLLAQAYKMRGKKKLPQVVLALAFNGIKRGVAASPALRQWQSCTFLKKAKAI